MRIFLLFKSTFSQQILSYLGRAAILPSINLLIITKQDKNTTMII